MSRKLVVFVQNVIWHVFEGSLETLVVNHKTLLESNFKCDFLFENSFRTVNHDFYYQSDHNLDPNKKFEDQSPAYILVVVRNPIFLLFECMYIKVLLIKYRFLVAMIL